MRGETARDPRPDDAGANVSRWAFAGVIALIVASIPAYRLIPGWGSAWGLDLQNVYAFHTCWARNDPYVATGVQCGDPLGRAMPYPPLLYWALAWLRWVSFPAAVRIWSTFLACVLLATAAFWSGRGKLAEGRWRACLIGALLLTQFPAVFAMERGNNDGVLLLAWTAATALLRRGWSFFTGGVVGLAAAAKLYPIIGCAVVLAGAAGAARRGGAPQRAMALRMAAGVAVGIVAPALAFWPQTQHFMQNVLPAFAARVPAPSLYSHSVPSSFGAAAPVISAGIALAWCVASYLAMDVAPEGVFAGALAVSTYVARTSFDYNLITTYPLLVVLAARAFVAKVHDRAALVVLLVGLVAITGDRGWFGRHAVAHVVLQIGWLAMTAAWLVEDRPVDLAF
jgi:hypothetical protein